MPRKNSRVLVRDDHLLRIRWNSENFCVCECVLKRGHISAQQGAFQRCIVPQTSKISDKGRTAFCLCCRLRHRTTRPAKFSYIWAPVWAKPLFVRHVGSIRRLMWWHWSPFFMWKILWISLLLSNVRLPLKVPTQSCSWWSFFQRANSEILRLPMNFSCVLFWSLKLSFPAT